MNTWTDLGNDQWKLTVTVDGDPTAQPSVFRGTRDQILDKLADSQANANRRLAELRRQTNGNGHGSVPPPVTTAPRPLSTAERLETVADLQNPATVDRAITRVVESVTGSPLKNLGESDRIRTATQAAEMFAERTPEWYPSDHNKQVLVNYMKTQGLNPLDTLQYTRAFSELSAAQLLQVKPQDAEPDNDEPETDEGRNAPTPTPRPRTATRYSTSIRSSDISGRPPVPSGKPHLKYTREQLQNLSAEDYKRLMQTDRAEVERCEAYYAKTPARRVG